LSVEETEDVSLMLCEIRVDKKAFAVDLPIHREHPGPLVLDWQIQNRLGATNNLIKSILIGNEKKRMRGG